MSDSRNAGENSDEPQLIRDVLAGRHNQFEELMIRYQAMVFGMIKKQVRDDATARDLSQETFIRAFKGLKKFRFQSAFSTWITRIALNVTHSYFSSRRYREMQKNVALDPSHINELPENAAEESGDPATLAFLQHCIGALKPKFREVIVLCSLEGKTYAEAAEILQVPVGTVCSRMNTALMQLRQAFSKHKTQGSKL